MSGVEDHRESLRRLPRGGWTSCLDRSPEEAVLWELYDLAADPRWRVREDVVMALQRLGDVVPEALWSLVRTWALDHDPLVQRAAVAGICEPRLLRDRRGSAVALEVCATVTGRLAEAPLAHRRDTSVRVLRQTLGYCWSVAVAADPSTGLPMFAALAADPDPDVAWIVRENRKKTRLNRLLTAAGGDFRPGGPGLVALPRRPRPN